MINVFVADDHAVVREGLARILEICPDLSFAGSAQGASEVIALARDAAWDVIVLDLSLPDAGGCEVLRQLRALRPEIPIVVYSMYPEEQFGIRMLQAGAAAYLSKSRSTDELLEAIRRAHRGLRYVTQPIAQLLLESSGDHDGDGSRLSEREFQILQLMVEGSRTSDIARSLYISPSTVSTHVKRIKEKLGVSSNAELIQVALRRGLVG